MEIRPGPWYGSLKKLRCTGAWKFGTENIDSCENFRRPPLPSPGRFLHSVRPPDAFCHFALPHCFPCYCSPRSSPFARPSLLPSRLPGLRARPSRAETVACTCSEMLHKQLFCRPNSPVKQTTRTHKAPSLCRNTRTQFKNCLHLSKKTNHSKMQFTRILFSN